MSAKISALPAATEIANLDIFPLVTAGGTNKKVPRYLILTAAAGQGISLLGNAGSYFDIGTAGNLNLNTPAGQKIIIGQSPSQAIVVEGDGSISLGNGSPAFSLITDALGQLDIDVAGHVVLESGDGESVDVTYVPADGSFWSGTPPATFAEAIDRIAAVVSVGGGTPIP